VTAPERVVPMYPPPDTVDRLSMFFRTLALSSACNAPRQKDAERMPPPENARPTKYELAVGRKTGSCSGRVLVWACKADSELASGGRASEVGSELTVFAGKDTASGSISSATRPVLPSSRRAEL